MFKRKTGSRETGSAVAPPAGGIEDFGEVYREYLHPVYSFVAYRVGQRQAAEDVTAQVFEKAWRSRAGYNPALGGLSTWLFSIARHAVIDHLRLRARDPELGHDAGQQPAGGADPLQELEALELRRELASAIAALDEREREIVSLKFGARLNNRQIAELLEISESNAGTILFRSLKKLKIRLEGGSEND